MSAVPDWLEPHEPICIEGNSMFTEVNGVVSGSGTESDPYVIEGWSIDATATNGIEIRFTTAHVVIRDVHIYNGSETDCFYSIWSEDWMGIILEQTENVRLERIFVDTCSYGIFARSCYDLSLVDSEIGPSTNGMFVDNSHRFSIEDNVFRGPGSSGVRIVESTDFGLARNSVEGWTRGIEIDYDCDGAVLEDNSLSLNMIGLKMTGCRDIDVSGNNLAFNRVAGALLKEAIHTNLTANLLEGNGCGVYSYGCAECAVLANDLVDNDMQAFEDEGDRNIWNESSEGTGNYWSDHSGSGPRAITTGIADYSPRPAQAWDGDRIEDPSEPWDDCWSPSNCEALWRTNIEEYEGAYSGDGPMEMIAASDGTLHAVYPLAYGIVYARGSAEGWVTRVIDMAYSTSSPAIALDDDGNVHIAYVNNYYSTTDTTSALMHATDEDGTFRLYKEKEMSYEGGDFTVAIGPDLSLHLIEPEIEWVQYDWYSTRVLGLTYSTDEGGGWQSEELVPVSYRSISASMCIDDDGSAHIAYSATNDSGDGALSYTTNRDGEWVDETVSETGPLSFYIGESAPQIALDGSSNPHIAFARMGEDWHYATAEGEAYLCYAKKTGPEWTVADAVSDFRLWTVVGLDVAPDGSAHALYYDGYNSDPVYATNQGANGSIWKTERLETLGDSGERGDIVVDDKGNVHIIFLSRPNFDAALYAYVVDIAYVTSSEPALGSEDGIDIRYVLLAIAVIGAVAGAAFYRRWRV